jgi:hypothetical protein
MRAPDAAEAELQAAALDLALHQGSLRSPEAVAGFRASSGGLSWVLLDGQGNPLARLPRSAVVRQAERRRQRLDQLLSNARRRGVSATHWRTALRLRSWEERAQAWGLSAHQPVPEPVFTGRRLAIAGALLLLGLVPGLLYLGSLLLQRFRRQRALRDLVRAWTFRGRPDPLEKG